VATDIALDKVGANRLARISHDGLARAINPAHTPIDGDTMFALATGKNLARIDLTVLGILAAEVTAQAVLRAVQAAILVSRQRPGRAGLALCQGLRRHRSTT